MALKRKLDLFSFQKYEENLTTSKMYTWFFWQYEWDNSQQGDDNIWKYKIDNIESWSSFEIHGKC